MANEHGVVELSLHFPALAYCEERGMRLSHGLIFAGIAVLAP